MRLRGLLGLMLLAGLGLVPVAFPAAAAQLRGTVGPGFSITLDDAAGNGVTQVDPGAYEIVVRDLSPEHNFHLTGPGVNEATGVETEGTVTWPVTLQEGRYTIVCDPHALSMRLRLTVGNPPTTTPPPAPKPKPKLLATVGPKPTISLRSATGAALKTVKAGTYSIVVRDRSAAHNFHLVGKGVNRKSSVAGVGMTTWTVRLQAGVLRFYSDRAPKTVKGSVTVK
jgi:hypothetical protein